MGMFDARIHVITSESGVRFLIRDLLRDIGYDDIILGGRFQDIQIAVTENKPDLMIIGTSFPDGDPMSLIREVRNQELGSNPFLVMMAITTQPTKSLVKEVVNSGADDLLVYPLSRTYLQSRIETLVENRKQFLITADYMGPDRRTPNSYRPGTETQPLFDAPNMLRAKVKGDISEAEVQKAIKSTLSRMDGYQLQSYLRKICWLIDRIAVGYAWADGGMLEPDIKSFLKELVISSDAAVNLSDAENQSHFKYLCTTIFTLSSRIAKDLHKASIKDKELLPELSSAIRASLNSSGSSDAAREIQNMIEKKYKEAG